MNARILITPVVRCLGRMLLLVVAIVTTATIAKGQIDWHPAHGNLDGGRVTAFAFDSTASGNIYAGSRCDLFRFDRELDRWVVEAPHLPAHALAVTGSGALIVGSDSAIFRIAFSGAAPERVSSLGQPSSIAAGSNRTAIAFVPPRYLIRSADDGRNWEIIDSTLSFLYPGRTVVASPDGTYFSYGSLYNGTLLPVRRSDDDGLSWVDLGGIPSGKIYAMIPFGGGHLVAIGEFNGADSIYRSTDNGQTWTRSATPGLFKWSVGPDKTIYAMFSSGTGSGSPLYRSTDSARTWSELGPSISEALGAGHSGEIWKSENGRIFLSGDSGRSWEDRTKGFMALQFPEIQSDSSGRLFAIAGSESGYYKAISPTGSYRMLDRSALYRSLDNGQNWTRLVESARKFYGSVRNGMLYIPHTRKLGALYSRDLGDTWDSIVINNSDQRFGGVADNTSGKIVMTFAATGENLPSEIAISSDRGRTWGRSTVPELWANPYVTESGRIFVERYNVTHGGQDLMTSIDDGESWQIAIPGIGASDIETDRNGEIFVTGNQGGPVLYRSTDEGETFDLQHQFPVGTRQWNLTFTHRGDLILIGTDPLRSSDAGRTWETLSPQRIAYANILSAPDGTLYSYFPIVAPWVIDIVGTGVVSGFYRSADYGDTWIRQNDPAPIHSTVSLAITPSGQLFVGTNGCGLYSDRPTSRVGVSEPAPLSIAIDAVEPNPMRGKTFARITLAARQDIALTLSDLTGRRIATLHRGVVEAGSTELAFDASALVSGAYILTLRGDDEAVSRRVIVLR